jgi:hypothetical protein
MSETEPEVLPVSQRSRSETLSRWLAPTALVLAVIAIAIATWSLVKPMLFDATPKPSSQQIADAKFRACTAYDVVRKAVSIQTHIEPGTDPIAVSAVNANARLSMASGASYLQARLDPAASDDVASAIRSFADRLQEISLYAQAEENDPAQAARLRDAEAANQRVADLCK